MNPDAALAPPPPTLGSESCIGDPGWTLVCPLEGILPETGACALVGDRQVAVFRLLDGSLRALDNRDPCSGANVLARGIVGDADGLPVVFSPLFKDRFDLVTGACLDHTGVRVGTHPVRVVDGMVEVASAVAPAPLGP